MKIKAHTRKLMEVRSQWVAVWLVLTICLIFVTMATLHLMTCTDRCITQDLGAQCNNIQPNNGIFTSPYSLVWFTLFGGTLISFLLFILMRILLYTQQKTQKNAQVLTFDLQKNEQRLNQLAILSRTITWEVDACGLYTFVSSVVEQVLGYKPDELIGKKHFYDLHPEDGREAFKTKAFEAFANRQPFINFENRMQSKTGEIIYIFSTNGIPLLDEHGDLIGYQGNDTDITERKRATESQTLLTMAIEQAAEAIMITKPDGTMIYVNPSFVKVTGYQHKEAIGQNPRILKSDKQDAEFYRQMWMTLTAGQVWHGRLVNKRKNGSLYEEDATISPVHDDHGTIINYVAVKRNVTHEVELEGQLRQSQKMESVGLLAGGVAHDFNNMLQSVMGFAELALEQLPSDHPVRADLNEILKGTRRTADLTKQLLTFASKQTIAPRKLYLNDVVETSLNMLRILIGENINLIWLPGTTLWPVKVDPSQVAQILTNLCINSRDAIANIGKITIETTNYTVDGSYYVGQADVVPGDYVILIISDDGCGMTKEIIDHIFEPFFTTKGLGKGTGLGLSTVYGIVKQNNGFINVYSEHGKGTTFRIYLPRFEGEAVKYLEHPADTINPNGTETILLVEDEIGVKATVERFLEQFGYTVLSAETPELAFNMVAHYDGPIHLLLTDVIMPGMNGWDMAKKLTTTRPAMKALFISGYTANIIAQRGILETNVDFLAKPFTRDTLIRKVREVLNSDIPSKSTS